MSYLFIHEISQNYTLTSSIYANRFPFGGDFGEAYRMQLVRQEEKKAKEITCSREIDRSKITYENNACGGQGGKRSVQMVLQAKANVDKI